MLKKKLLPIHNMYILEADEMNYWKQQEVKDEKLRFPQFSSV